MSYPIKTKYINEDCEIVGGHYADGSAALRVVSLHGEPIAVATVCLDEPARDGHVWLKGWSENEGLPEALEVNGVVKRTGRTYPTGYVEAEEAVLCPILLEAKGE